MTKWFELLQQASSDLDDIRTALICAETSDHPPPIPMREFRKLIHMSTKRMVKDGADIEDESILAGIRLLSSLVTIDEVSSLLEFIMPGEEYSIDMMALVLQGIAKKVGVEDVEDVIQWTIIEDRASSIVEQFIQKDVLCAMKNVAIAASALVILHGLRADGASGLTKRFNAYAPPGCQQFLEDYMEMVLVKEL
jgi:hypothetical protein